VHASDPQRSLEFALSINRSIRAHRIHLCETENETNRVEDVRLSRTIETGNGVKRWIPARNLSSDRIRLKAFDNEFFYMHSVESSLALWQANEEQTGELSTAAAAERV
jgi:hypothetical protein